MAVNTIILNWSSNSGNEDGFKIYRSTDGVNFGPPIDTVAAGITTYEASVTPGVHYWFRVTAYSNTAGESTYTQAGPYSYSLKTIILDWVDNDTNEVGYNVYKSIDGSNFYYVESLPANSETYIATGITEGQQYWFKVEAYNTYSSVESNIDSISCFWSPTEPTLLTFTYTTSGQLDLFWQDNSVNELGFVIEKSINGVDFFQLDTVGIDTENYTDVTIINGQLSYFRVYAYNNDGNSGYSNIVSIICGLPIGNIGYWPNNYWAPYWFTHYWQVFFQTKFIARMRRVSLHRRNL